MERLAGRTGYSSSCGMELSHIPITNFITVDDLCLSDTLNLGRRVVIIVVTTVYTFWPIRAAPASPPCPISSQPPVDLRPILTANFGFLPPSLSSSPPPSCMTHTPAAVSPLCSWGKANFHTNMCFILTLTEKCGDCNNRSTPRTLLSLTFLPCCIHSQRFN